MTITVALGDRLSRGGTTTFVVHSDVSEIHEEGAMAVDACSFLLVLGLLGIVTSYTIGGVVISCWSSPSLSSCSSSSAAVGPSERAAVTSPLLPD